METAGSLGHGGDEQAKLNSEAYVSKEVGATLGQL